MNRRSWCLGLAALVAVGGAAWAQEPEVEAATPRIEVEQGEVAVGELIQRWARASGRLAVIDPVLEPMRARFAEAGALEPATLMRLLDFYDVVVTETGSLINAHHRRNLPQKEGPPWRVVREPEELARLNQVVTRVIPVRNGAGNAIFATVRGLLTRDTNRLGNILYLQGPELIVLVDLADKVAYYEEVIGLLDQAPKLKLAHITVTAAELPRASWRELSRAQQGEALLTALDDAIDAGRASLLEEASLASVQGRFLLERVLSLPGEGRLSMSVSTEGDRGDAKQEPHGGPLFSAAGAEVLRVRLVLEGTEQRMSRDLAVLVPRAGREPQVLAVAGREGMVLVVAVRPAR